MKTNSFNFLSGSVAGIGLLATAFALPLPALAQSNNVDMAVNNPDPLPTRSLSKGEIENAKPFINPLPAPDTILVEPANGFSAVEDQPASVPGAKGQQTTGPRAYGSFGVPFTSKRVTHQPVSVVASSSGNYLSATYPYRAIGRLTFNAGFCSASLIRKSVIVTAAHCIQDFGSGSNTFSGWTFTPASYNGSAPYGSWGWQALVRPASWINGTDIGSGSARDNDLAVIILRKNAQGQFIGNITGQLSYGWNNYSFVKSNLTGNLWTAALTTLGYPFLLDAGRILERSDGPSYLTSISGAGQIYQGSNFTGGSSGGPWIANFGYQNPAFAGGANGGLASNNNVVVGVTSWGASDPNVRKDNWSSQFRQNTRYPLANYGGFGAGNIASLLYTVCSAKPTGSTLTYQQLGYCN
ncbi:MAG: trypsin-like serine protease [Candidatus Contendobacter sp.]|jgi:V8-like Glu-specific endopeptidase|nr:trypsin-like serine protease [Gammaproteobacteria bacterium]MCC8992148.1 trypsin-like serine protease [Candidatus Contendobacter sp.]